jgi:hypothetical protein
MAQDEPNDGLPDVDIDALMDQADSAAEKMAAALGALQKTTSRVRALRGRKTSADLVDTEAGTDAGLADPLISEPSSDTQSTPPENFETAEKLADEKTGEDRFPERAEEDSPTPSGDNTSDEEKQASGLLVTGGSVEQTELAVEMVDDLMDEVVRQVESTDPETETSSQSEKELGAITPPMDAAALSAAKSSGSVASAATKQSDMDEALADSESMPIVRDDSPARDVAADSETDQIGDEESITDLAEAALAATESLIQDIESKGTPATRDDLTTADLNQDKLKKHSMELSTYNDTDASDAMDAMDAMEALVEGLEEESPANGSDDSDVDDGSSDKKDPIDEALSSMEDLIQNLDQGPAPQQTDEEPGIPTHEDEEAPAESDQKASPFEEFDREKASAAASGGTVLKASAAPNEILEVSPEKPSSARDIDADSVLADMEALIAEATGDSASSAPAQEQKNDTTAHGHKSKSDEAPSSRRDQPALRDAALEGDEISIGNVTASETAGSGKPVEKRQTPKAGDKEQTLHSVDAMEGSETGDQQGAAGGGADPTAASPLEPKMPLTQRPSRFCLGIIRRVFQALDAPFSGMRGRWKTLAGYMAFGTLFMALTVWVVSSFGNLK